jgi:hypothetical protein
MSGIMLNVVGGSFSSAPGAPTIGTATATSNTTATVAYTAPVSNGGSVITSYTATSSPGGLTGTLSQAGSGTITVTGLTGSTSYTFTVTATNAIGTSAPSSASNSITTEPTVPTVIGEPFRGGYYAGKVATGGGGVATFYLVVADKTVGQSSTLKWSASQVTTGVTSTINGPTNSASLAALGYPMASFCENLNTGGYTDWYMPAKDELEILYYFLKPNTNSNWTSSGSNAYAVSPQPINTNYSSGSPAQTSATSFRTGASSQEFSTVFYFSSTEYSANDAWAQTFNDGTQSNANKTFDFLGWSVRAVRRVPV